MILLAYFSLFALSLMDNSRGPLLPLVQESLKINSSTVSFIFTGASFASAFINFVLPKLQAKFEMHKLYFVSMLLMPISAFFWLFAKNHPVCFYLAPILYGLGAGGVGTFCNIYIISFSTEGKRQKSLSFLHMMYGVASFLVPLMITVLLTRMDWACALLFLSTPSFFIAFLLLRKRAIIPLHEDHRPNFPWHLSWVSSVFALGITSEIFISSRLVNHLYRDQGLSFREANYYLSLFFILMVLGRLFFSYVKVNLNKVHLLQLSFFLTILFSGLGITVHPIFFSFIGLSVSWFFPVGINWIREDFHPEYFSLIAMIMSFNSVVLLAMHFTVGELTDLIGLKRLMILPIILSSVALVVLQIYGKKRSLPNLA